MVKKTLDVEAIKNYLKQGLKSKEIAEKLGIGYKAFTMQIYKNGLSLKALKTSEKTPQERAWITMRKNEAVAAYNTATSAGTKASLSRKFNKEYGTTIATYLEIPKVKKIKVKRATKPATTKESFEAKEVEYMIPKRLRLMFEALTKRIETLEAR